MTSKIQKIVHHTSDPSVAMTEDIYNIVAQEAEALPTNNQRVKKLTAAPKKKVTAAAPVDDDEEELVNQLKVEGEEFDDVGSEDEDDDGEEDEAPDGKKKKKKEDEDEEDDDEEEENNEGAANGDEEGDDPNEKTIDNDAEEVETAADADGYGGSGMELGAVSANHLRFMSFFTRHVFVVVCQPTVCVSQRANRCLVDQRRLNKLPVVRQRNQRQNVHRVRHPTRQSASKTLPTTTTFARISTIPKSMSPSWPKVLLSLWQLTFSPRRNQTTLAIVCGLPVSIWPQRIEYRQISSLVLLVSKYQRLLETSSRFRHRSPCW